MKLPGALERLYVRLLRAYPAEFRQEYGQEMAQFFRDECIRHRSLSGLILLGFKTLADVARTAPGVHMEILRQDLRFALRMLRNSPALTLTATVALALGIGANSAIFSLVHGVLLMPLRFPEPDRLVMVWDKNPRGIDRNHVAPPNFADYRSASKSFSGIAAFYEESANLTDSGEPEHLTSAVVSPEFFDVLGVRPLAGTGLTTDAGVVLSHGLWQRRFGSNRDVIGRPLRIDGKDYTVRGVMPADFRFPSSEVALWTSMPFDPARYSRQARFMSTVARLKPETSPAQAHAELAGIAAGLAQTYPASNLGWGVTVVPLKEQIAGPARQSLFVLLGAVGLVLLIACTNVANLLLARGTHRRGEIAIRRALGADSTRIVRQMLTESTLLSLLGGAAGLALSFGALHALKVLQPAALPRLDELGLNGWSVAFTFAIALLTGIISGLAPAFGIARLDPKRFRTHRLRGAMIAAEVAFSVVLALGAGLLIRTFLHLNRLDPGFRADQVVTLTFDLPEAGRRNAFLDQTLTRVRALAGVHSAGMISTLPLAGGEGFNRFGFNIEGRPDQDSPRFYARWITTGYLAGMAIPLLSGRDFVSQEPTPVAIIDAALARRHFPNENPLGRFVRFSYNRATPHEIIGVAGDVRLVALDKEPAPLIYIPVIQGTQGVRVAAMTLVVRGGSAEGVRAAIREVDPRVPVYDVQPMAERVAESIAPRRFNMLLMSLLAALALALAAVGIYGLIGCIVGERQHEIGVRMALGARPVEILALVVRQGMMHALGGLAVGIAAALLLTRALTRLLYGVTPLDWRTFVAGAVLTAAVAFLACLVPARRAAKVDPARALRTQ